MKSFSSLLAVGSDPGSLRSVKLVWKEDLVWSSLMRRVRNIHELEQLRSGHGAQRLEDPHQIRRDSGEVRFCLF